MVVLDLMLPMFWHKKVQININRLESMWEISILMAKWLVKVSLQCLKEESMPKLPILLEIDSQLQANYKGCMEYL